MGVSVSWTVEGMGDSGIDRWGGGGSWRLRKYNETRKDK